MHIEQNLIQKLNKRKKRRIHVENWMDVKRKILRDSGQAYTTRKGKDRPKKNVSTKVIWKNVLCAYKII